MEINGDQSGELVCELKELKQVSQAIKHGEKLNNEAQ